LEQELETARSQLTLLENAVDQLRGEQAQQAAAGATREEEAACRLAAAERVRDALAQQVEDLLARQAAREAALAREQGLVRELRGKVKEAAAEMGQLQVGGGCLSKWRVCAQSVASSHILGFTQTPFALTLP
jgi:DNA repair exonuclease SbcCD ATPase subunit